MTSNQHWPDEYTGTDGKQRIECNCGNVWPCPHFSPIKITPQEPKSPTDTELLDYLERMMKLDGFSYVFIDSRIQIVANCHKYSDPSATAIVRPTLRECLIEAMRRERG